MFRTYHIIDKAEHQQLNGRNQLCRGSGSHWIDVNATQILVCYDFQGNGATIFSQQAQTATHLPHPVYNQGVLITEQQAQVLAGCVPLFPDCTTPEQRLAMARTLCCCHVAQRAGTLHPSMKLSHF